VSPRRLIVAALLLLVSGCGAGAGAAPAPTPPAEPAGAEHETPESMLAEPIQWRRSTAVGLPFAGRLRNGVQLPSEGEDFFTWDSILHQAPNREWRRYGTDRLVRVLLKVLAEYRAANPDAPRVAIGDLSRPRGGNFGPQYGGPGHASHQNGLDADVYYPRTDGRERAPARVEQVDRVLAQDLVDRFVRAGAQYVFVGPHVGLRGPKRIVQPRTHHDNHLHVRIRRR
jgi:murein endopeptidase